MDVRRSGIAALAQLGLNRALEQRDHVLDHAVQLVGRVLVLGRGGLAPGTCQARWRVEDFDAQRLRPPTARSHTEFDALARFEPLDTGGQRRGPDIDVLAFLLRQKAEALLGVVPLNPAGRHWSHLLVF